MPLRTLPCAVLLLALLATAGCGRKERSPEPLATGRGGAVATIDVRASQAALDVLRAGGNAVDAAVAASAVLGVTDPHSCGIGGGGFLLLYLAREERVVVVEHREPAPAGLHRELLYENGLPIPFDERVASGLSTGVPGMVAAWDLALRRYGTQPLAPLLKPAIRVAEEGFAVDQAFTDQTLKGLDRMRAFSSTSALFLTPEGQPLPVGATFRNRDLAHTYRLLAREGPEVFYRGEIARAIVDTLAHPPLAEGTLRNVRPGVMQLADLSGYEVRIRPAVQTRYRGLTLYGAGPPSSGALSVGELLHLLEGFAPAALSLEELLHLFLEASRLTFADRAAFITDPEFFPVPVSGLLSDGYAAERRAALGPVLATRGVALPGNPLPYETDPSVPVPAPPPPPPEPPGESDEGPPGSTTHLTVADADGNIAAYTCSLEQEGGNGMVVPGYGFLLNNELTNFDVPPTPDLPHPNVTEPFKRPRSSMSPTFVFRDGRPLLALGSPGGATIITTVALVLVRTLDLGMPIEEAIAAPRLADRNLPGGRVEAEPELLALPEAVGLAARGHRLVASDPLGAVTALVFNEDGTVTAAAEPVRRGGGSARVVRPP